MAGHPLQTPRLLSHEFITLALAANGGAATVNVSPILQPFNTGTAISGEAVGVPSCWRPRIVWHVDNSSAATNLRYLQATLNLRAGGPNGTQAPYQDQRPVSSMLQFTGGDIVFAPVAQFYAEASLTLTNWYTSSLTFYVRTLVFGDLTEYVGLDSGAPPLGAMPGGYE